MICVICQIKPKARIMKSIEAYTKVFAFIGTLGKDERKML